MPDINPILAAAKSTSTLVGDTGESIAGFKNSQAEYENTNAQMQIDLGTSDILIKSVKKQGELASQNALLKVGAIFGADINQQGEVLTQAASDMRAAYEAKKAASDAIAKNSSISFMDNPLQFIVNQFKHNDLVDAYYNAERKETDAANYINEVNVNSSASAKNQDNFKVSITQASLEAESDKIAKTAIIAANTHKIAGLGYNSQALDAVTKASVEQLNLKFQTLSAQNSQAQLKLAMDNYALNKEQFDWKQEEKEASKLGDDYIIERMQKGFSVLYGDKAPDFTASPKLGKQFLQLLKTGGAAGKEAQEAFMAGQSGIIAGTPSQLVDSIKFNIQIQFNPDQKPIKELFNDTINSIQEQYKGRVVDKKVSDVAIDASIKKSLDDMLAEIKPGDPKNVFNIPTPALIIKTSPAVSATPFAQKVLIPILTSSKSGETFENASSVYATMVSAVENKQISIEEAVSGYTALYQRGVEMNLAVKNLPKFGLLPNEKMHQYKTSIEVDPTAMWGGSKIIDNTDQNVVKRELMKTLSKKAMLEMSLIAPR